MKKIVIAIITLALGFGVSAQQGMQSNYIGLNLGGGLNTLAYTTEDGNHHVGLGCLAELKYIHFFSRHIGLGAGVQINFSNASTTYSFTEVGYGLVHPDNGLTYNQKTVYNDWKERQHLTTFNVPIELFYRNRINQQWTYLIGAGVELNFPLSGTYTADEGSYEIRANFPGYGSYDVHHLANHGFDEYTADAEADINLASMGVSVVAELGFNRELSNHWGLNFGVYAGYGLTNLIEEESSDPIIQLDGSSASQITYAGTFGSNQTDAMHLLNVGIKVGVNLGWDCKHDKGMAAAGAAAAGAATGAALVPYQGNNDQPAERLAERVEPIKEQPAVAAQPAERPAERVEPIKEQPAVAAQPAEPTKAELPTTPADEQPAEAAAPTEAQPEQPATYSVTPSMFGNDAADDEAAAAEREARCNARRMNNPDMAQARADFESDIADAERMANESGDEDAKNAVADAKAHAADAARAYEKGKYCRAYDLYNEAYGDIANSYAADANHYAAKTDNIHAAQGAQDAELYAEAAHRDGLDCAIAASRNAKINAEIARDADASVRGDNSACTNPSYANNFVNEAIRLADRSGSKPAMTDAKDASGKAYRGNLADAYAAAAKSLAESAHAFADRCHNEACQAAAADADRYAADAARAAKGGDVQAAYRAALMAKEAAYRASRCENAHPAAELDPATRSLLDAIGATVYFGFNATAPEIDNKTNVALRALSKAMAANNDLHVMITGHTDNVGSDSVNKELGFRRAEAVKQVMVGMGAPASSISVDSKGMSEPAANNDTQENRDLNRRAVISIR